MGKKKRRKPKKPKRIKILIEGNRLNEETGKMESISYYLKTWG